MAPDRPESETGQSAPPPGPQRRARVSGEVLAFVLSLAWFALLVTAFVVLGGRGMAITDTLGLVVLALAVFLPVALIWLAVLVLRAARQMRDEAARLEQTVGAMQRGWLREQQAAGRALEPTVDAKLDAIAEAQRKTDSTLSMFTTRRTAPLAPVAPRSPAPREGGESQPVLALENPLPATGPLAVEDFIRALNFPDTAQDEAGFAALRRALSDHATAELVRAAQDVLTALSQEGIYKDDLRPDRARPDIWRAFAQGLRGAPVAALGGVRDRSCLALTIGRMRADPAFRDAAHRFLRAFDRRFSAFETQASDGDIARFSETRSARAFMLLGRVTGVFG